MYSPPTVSLPGTSADSFRSFRDAEQLKQTSKAETGLYKLFIYKNIQRNCEDGLRGTILQNKGRKQFKSRIILHRIVQCLTLLLLSMGFRDGIHLKHCLLLNYSSWVPFPIIFRQQIAPPELNLEGPVLGKVM